MRRPFLIDRRQALFALTASLYAPRFAAASQAQPSETFFTAAFLREQLPAWSDASRAVLQRALSPANGGRIDAQTVTELAAATGGSVDTLMMTLAPMMRRYARPPISNFFVGALARGRSGALYAGTNIEVPQNGLNQSVHGEQAVVANAFGHGETGIEALVATGSNGLAGPFEAGAPCGHCRQFLNELNGGADLRILMPGKPAVALKNLLPDSFGPADLQQTEAIFASKPHALRLPASATGPLATAALDAAVRSYAPYSHSPSGCAIQTKAGTIVSGSYLENAAFNPSLAPLQSALVALVMRQEAFADIVRVVLVESSGRTISHAAETRMVLAALAPRATLTVLSASVSRLP